MSSSICTVAKARQTWGFLVPPDPDTGADNFLSALNVGIERLTKGGKWLGAMVNLAVQPMLNVVGNLGNAVVNGKSGGYLTLPRRYAAVLESRFGCIPIPTFGQFHNYIESGPGGFQDAENPTLGIFTDDGDVWCSQVSIPPSMVGSLQIGITNIADAGKTVRLFGLGGNGTRIYDKTGDGYNLVTAFPMSASNGQAVSILEALQGPLVTNPPTYFVGSWSLWFNYQGTLIQLGQYEPTENMPRYHRYTFGQLIWPPNSQPNDWLFSFLAQRRYVPLVAETDFVIPDDMSALKYVILGGNHDLALQYAKAGESYAQAEEMLNAAQRSIRGGARPDANMAQLGAWGGFGWGGYCGGGGAGGGLPNVV